MSSHRRDGDDRGVVLILVALAMLAILIVAALVIDFGFVENTRQDSKRIADVTTAAGLQSLAPAGEPLPWAAVCSALDYLQANRSDLDLSDPEFFDGTGSSVSGDPCTDLAGQICAPGVESTWAWIRVTDDDVTVDIRSGYRFTDPPIFPEDAGVYPAGDAGDPAQDGCDQLAVIIGDSDDAFFGGAAGATDYDTLIRSVGRVRIGNRGNVAVALVMLEQEDCRALNFEGGGGTGEIKVRGTGDRPGIIHADSAGTGDDCRSGGTVIVGKQNSGPRVRALSAPAVGPDGGAVHGVISTYAALIGRSNDANWTSDRMSQSTEVWMCDPDSAADLDYPGVVGPLTCATGPTGNERVTRRPADDRFLSDVTALRGEANAIFSQVASGTPTGYTRYTDIGGDCELRGGDPNQLITPLASGSALYVDCPTLIVGNGKELVIDAGITHVAFQGSISLSGDGLLDVKAPTQVFVHNRDGASAAIDAGSQGRFRINLNGAASCTARWGSAPTATTELVVRRGGLSGAGGGSVSMCSTFLHLMGGETSSTPVDTTAAAYPAPYANSQDGFFEVGGGGGADWTAPNTTTAEPGSGTYRFEDLAVWSEAQHDNIIRGGGAMVLKGIFFLPNTGPSDATGGVRIQGTSSGNINLDAQLWVRKFHHNGTPRLTMLANPADSIPLPFLEGLSLVR